MRRPVLAVVFFVGVLVGALANRWFGGGFRPPMPPPAEVLIKRLTRDLGLDDAQRAKALAILTDDHAKIVALHNGTRAQLEALRLGTHARLGGLLRPEQKERFEDLTRRWEEHHRRKFGPFPPPPPPPQ